MWPSGHRPQRSVSGLHPVPGVCVAAVWTIPLCVWVQRTLPNRNTQSSLRLPVWKLHRQLSEREAGHEVRKDCTYTLWQTCIDRVCFKMKSKYSLLLKMKWNMQWLNAFKTVCFTVLCGILGCMKRRFPCGHIFWRTSICIETPCTGVH